jgi:cytochrome b561
MVRSALVRTDRYTRVAIFFHWTIAAMVIFNLWLGLFHDSLPKEWKVMPVHKATGITILALSVARLAWRLMNSPPPSPIDLPAWQRTAARASHWAFYALLIVLPVTGWMMSSGGNPPRPLNWFGLFPIPYLPVDKALAGFGHEAHEILGYLMAVLVVIHIGAALGHHLILRDSVLLRMLPFAR